MKLFFLAFVLFIVSFESCISWKKTQSITGNQDDAIQNAIIDFMHTKRFFKDDSVFSIRTKNVNKDVLGVVIFAAKNKLSVITGDKINYSYKSFPNKYFEQYNKLFYWNDSSKNLSPELINKLIEMNRIDTVILNEYFPTRLVDDGQKAVHYYFCKANLKKYKRVYTNIAMGWYDAPTINCRN